MLSPTVINQIEVSQVSVKKLDGLNKQDLARQRSRIESWSTLSNRVKRDISNFKFYDAHLPQASMALLINLFEALNGVLWLWSGWPASV